jgi:hypothetical protein
MYVTVWKYLKDNNQDFSGIEWSRNLRLDDSYYETVVLDAEEKLKHEMITGYTVKQFQLDVTNSEMYLFNHAAYIAPVVKRRIINPC